MLKYLLHSSKATLGADNVYRYNLDRKLGHKATVMILKDISFTAKSDIDPFPHVVYAHSDALTRIIDFKHTVELQDLSHDRSTNVIGVLKETHKRGRYKIEESRRFTIDPNEQLRMIDLYFTDGAGNKLVGAAASGGGGGERAMVPRQASRRFPALSCFWTCPPTRFWTRPTPQPPTSATWRGTYTTTEERHRR